eukprot:681965-Pleurochrysis_carterae.AAC.2
MRNARGSTGANCWTAARRVAFPPPPGLLADARARACGLTREATRTSKNKCTCTCVLINQLRHVAFSAALGGAPC